MQEFNKIPFSDLFPQPFYNRGLVQNAIYSTFTGMKHNPVCVPPKLQCQRNFRYPAGGGRLPRNRSVDAYTGREIHAAASHPISEATCPRANLVCKGLPSQSQAVLTGFANLSTDTSVIQKSFDTSTN